MSIALTLLKAESKGIRNFKNNFCKYIQRARPYVITDNGTPTSVVMPYNEVMELLDILDELQDPETLRIIEEGRNAIKRGAKGRLASKLFAKIRAKK